MKFKKEYKMQFLKLLGLKCIKIIFKNVVPTSSKTSHPHYKDQLLMEMNYVYPEDHMKDISICEKIPEYMVRIITTNVIIYF
jgi:hypothetical protein